MFFRKSNTQLDTSLFDPEHDMDLIALANNARTEDDVAFVVRISRARMRARRAELSYRRGGAGRARGPAL
jgi:hypothetical protein